MTRIVKTAVVVMIVLSLMGVASAIGQSADHVLKQTKARQEQALRKNLKKTFPPNGMLVISVFEVFLLL
jgi:hypothetical protein